MERTQVRIHTARPGELALIRAIDDDAVLLYADYGMPIELASDHPFTVGESRH